MTAILEHSDKLERVERVSDIDIHPLIKSALEKAFLESLRTVPGTQLQAKIVRGKPGYLWRSGETVWEIGLQVSVPKGPEVGTASIPDFVFYPVRPQTSRPVAVFLDGFAFHADEAAGHNRVALDVLQRQALVRSGKFWTWSFSWEDIQYRNEPAKIQATLFGEEHLQRRNEQLAPQVYSVEDVALARSAGEYTSWSLFLEFLAHPDERFWSKLSYLYSLSLPVQLQSVNMEGLAEVVRQLVQTDTAIQSLPAKAPTDGLAGVYSPLPQQLTSVTIVSQSGVKDRNPNEVFLLLRFDDDKASREQDFPKHWRGLLRLINRLQFLPAFLMVTVRGYKQGLFAGISELYEYFLSGGIPHRQNSPPAPDTNSELSSDIDLAHVAIRPLLIEIGSQNLARPTIGFEYMDGGVIIATAEVAWPDQTMVIISEEMLEDGETFRRKGWTVITFNSEGLTSENLKILMAKLQEKK